MVPPAVNHEAVYSWVGIVIKCPLATFWSLKCMASNWNCHLRESPVCYMPRQLEGPVDGYNDTS